RFGYMPEERGLYPKMRVREQLVYLARLRGTPKGVARSRATELLEVLEVVGDPNDRMETLSLGNQQRVQLAAALVHEPDVLVLDEPFSGLDPVGVDVLADVLRGQARDRGVPVVFSSHQLELVERLCGRSFLIATLINIAVISILVLARASSAVAPGASFDLGSVGPGMVAEGAAALGAQVGVRVDVRSFPDVTTAMAALRDGSVDA